MSGKKIKRPDVFQRLDPKPKADEATQPRPDAKADEHFPDLPQFERESGVHNRDRKSGWKADDEHAHSVENDDEEQKA